MQVVCALLNLLLLSVNFFLLIESVMHSSSFVLTLFTAGAIAYLCLLSYISCLLMVAHEITIVGPFLEQFHVFKHCRYNPKPPSPPSTPRTPTSLLTTVDNPIVSWNLKCGATSAPHQWRCHDRIECYQGSGVTSYVFWRGMRAHNTLSAVDNDLCVTVNWEYTFIGRGIFALCVATQHLCMSSEILSLVGMHGLINQRSYTLGVSFAFLVIPHLDKIFTWYMITGNTHGWQTVALAARIY